MAKKRTASETTLKPDARYNNKLASKFINCLMWDGKKPTAMRFLIWSSAW
jgi:small subunit ribosomal protein S7